jgi:hypothetical protein
VPDVLAGPIVFEASADFVAGFDRFMASAPRELGAVLGLTLAPPLPFVPADDHLAPSAVVVVCWSGEDAEGRDVVRALRDVGTVRGEAVDRMAYPVVNTLFEDLLPHGLRHYWKSMFLTDVSAADVEAFIEHGATTPNVESGIFFYPVDGAAADVPASASAWAHRDARWLVGYHGSWKDSDDDDRLRRWVDGAHGAGGEGAPSGAYLNFDSSDAPPGSAGYGAHFARLLEIKRRYDPHNLFCLNANIDPDDGA